MGEIGAISSPAKPPIAAASRKARPPVRSCSIPISRAPSGLEAVARSALPSRVKRNSQRSATTSSTQQPSTQSEWPDTSIGPTVKSASEKAGVRDASGPNSTSPAPTST